MLLPPPHAHRIQYANAKLVNVMLVALKRPRQLQRLLPPSQQLVNYVALKIAAQLQRFVL
jgi:hypothetical protein